MTQKHTPTLEILGHDDNGFYAVGYTEHDCDGSTQHVIAAEIGEREQADFIVKSCNSHAALVEALEALEARALEMRKLINPKTWSDLENMATVEIINARAALALAKGE